MREDQHRFLMLLGQLPARLTAEQAACVLNCQPHDIPALAAARLIKPMGFFRLRANQDGQDASTAQTDGWDPCH